MSFKLKSNTKLVCVSALAIGAAVAFGSIGDPVSLFAKSAFAESHSGNGQGNQAQGEGQGQGQGQGGQGSGGHEDGGHEDGGATDAGSGGSGNAGGPSDDSEGQGPAAGQGGSGGGKPVWAAEGIPEVELGRLSVARSPDSVLNRALEEALSNFTPEMADFYNLTLDQAILQLATNFDDLLFVDSPLQNLALFKDALDGSSILSTYGVSTPSTALLPVFLGTASDKTLEVTPLTAYAVVKILTGAELTDAQATALAADAEAVRVAVLTGHG
ncbi:hypothetical protein [Puniceibacterium sediminis]|uniref:Uncharacterized protein n=1 Tax=Puniceibacterium sediminis TaxID=1608407 RepID=A0A238UTR0_9RHOB|nr:hypothetical protein [Puniceibacterium sediminis]SNR25502.1 hypothetical protein SAMN06265370_101115 [Puniceibacterium sediminis]